MKVKMHELRNTDACKAKREFQYNLQREISPFMEKAGIIKQIIADCLDGKIKKEDVEAILLEKFSDLQYTADKQRELQAYDAYRQISRYISSEKRRLMHGIKADINLGQDLVVTLKPDYIYATENIIEVIQIKCSKPNVTQKAAAEDLGLYALFNYGKALIMPGETRTIKASYYFLRKENDSSSAEKPNFDVDFFETTGGRNIISISGEYTNDASVSCKVDESFKKIVTKYITSIPKEECTKSDCDVCDIKELCNFTCAPFAIVKTETKKSLRDINLSLAQEEIVEYENGILCVNAGAGAGKTMVLALRTCTLIEKGCLPERILLITYTNAGAEEMRSRISALLDDFGIDADISGMYIMTFNAFGDMILKDKFTELGFTAPPKVIDDIERSRIIADLLNNTAIEGLNYRDFDCNMKTCMGALAVAKTVFTIVKEGQYSARDLDKVIEKMETKARFASRSAVASLIGLYDKYDEKLREENLIEFSDQEVLVFEYLHKDPFYLEKFGYEHIIVDEFQDTGTGQLNLIKKLIDCASYKSLMVVGDDSQSIYEKMKGARPEVIIHFEKFIGKAVDTINLVENYRSTPEIIDCANNMNKKRKDRVNKELIATRSSGTPVTVQGFLTKPEEKQFVLENVQTHLANGFAPEDICIIAATKYELMDMADILGKEGIPTVMLNPEPLMENSRVIAAIALCNAINAPEDTKDMLIYANAKVKGHDLLTVPKEIIEAAITEVKTEIEVFHSLDNEEIRKEKLLEMLQKLNENEDEVYESLLNTLQTKPTTAKIFEYCSDFKIFGSAASYRRLHNYPGVVLTTAHSSKGLEWPVVINMISKYDGQEYHEHSSRSHQMVEERKRLLFVSMTRARDELIITGQYVSHGKRGAYVYNQFLEYAYECIGSHFSATDVEQLRKKREDKKKEEKKAAEKAKKEAVKRTNEKMAS